jgi:integrase
MTYDPRHAVPRTEKPTTKPRESYLAKRKETVYSPEQLRTFAANAGKGQERALVTVAVLTGMRSSEIVGLRWRDFFEEEGKWFLRVAGTMGRRKGHPSFRRDGTKTHDTRLVALVPDVVTVLATQQVDQVGRGLGRPDDFIFTSTWGHLHGKQLSDKVPLRSVKRAMKAAGFPESDLRAMRVSFCEWMADTPSIPLKDAAAMAGHSVKTQYTNYVRKRENLAAIARAGDALAAALPAAHLTVIEGGKEEAA